MAEDRRMTASHVVDKLIASEHADVLRESVAWVLAELMEAEISTQIGAVLGERAPGERTSQRNGYRPRSWSTRAGELELAIPRLRTGSYFTSFLEYRASTACAASASSGSVPVPREPGRVERTHLKPSWLLDVRGERSRLSEGTAASFEVSELFLTSGPTSPPPVTLSFTASWLRAPASSLRSRLSSELSTTSALRIVAAA